VAAAVPPGMTAGRYSRHISQIANAFDEQAEGRCIIETRGAIQYAPGLLFAPSNKPVRPRPKQARKGKDEG